MPNSSSERAVLVGFERKSRGLSADAEESLDELKELAASAGAKVVESIFQTRQAPDAATLLGRGKVQEVKAMAVSLKADFILFDHDLSPTQQRNLEKELDLKVIDRTQLILDIFARRARTREGRLQVELAQLNYMLPRLSGHGVSMSRLGGGIGTRGPGETKLETDRRRISKRIRKIEDNLDKVRAGRSLHRNRRSSVPLPTLAMVGYTNAGKSTLFNRLTSASVLADAKMFATLDPTVRALALPSKRRVLLSDTVGFIRNLPITLVKAFRATLEEVADAKLILHVVDVSAAHSSSQTSHVLKVIAELGAAGTPRLLVLNKADRLAENQVEPETLRQRMLSEAGDKADLRAVMVSATNGSGVAALLQAIDQILPFDTMVRTQFRIPVCDGAEIASLHEGARVLSEHYGDAFCEIEADVSESVRSRLARYLVETPAGLWKLL